MSLGTYCIQIGILRALQLRIVDTRYNKRRLGLTLVALARKWNFPIVDCTSFYLACLIIFSIIVSTEGVEAKFLGNCI